jgi:hypothetical protein
MEYSYPQFRKNTTGKSYYQITSDHHMIEWQQIGSRIIRHELHATILPERLLIADLLVCSQGQYEKITENDFNSAIAQG